MPSGARADLLLAGGSIVRKGGGIFVCFTRLWALVSALAAQAVVSVLGCSRPDEAPQPAPAKPDRDGGVMLTIVYDNNAGREGLTAAWGFACVVEGLEKTILFDTGGDGRILLANMRRLGIDPRGIDVVVLSHIHGDHTGGLPSVLRTRDGLPVYVPAGFPDGFKRQVRRGGGVVVEAEQSVAVCPGARTTGTLGAGAIEEHGLCVQTPEGWVLLTGCAHPGVAELAARAREAAGPICLVVGGFHLGSHSRQEIIAVIDRLEALAVERVAPCHCTGNPARRLFAGRFGDRCTLTGVGGTFGFDGRE
jgi:7,8-dihydropterin-6-yl-methyl-4-(beta-D-ribofuranosyl)aminobenzene 5'-phosphate synthase